MHLEANNSSMRVAVPCREPLVGQHGGPLYYQSDHIDRVVKIILNAIVIGDGSQLVVTLNNAVS